MPSFKIGDSNMLMHVCMNTSGSRIPEKRFGANIHRVRLDRKDGSQSSFEDDGLCVFSEEQSFDKAAAALLKTIVTMVQQEPFKSRGQMRRSRYPSF